LVGIGQALIEVKGNEEERESEGVGQGRSKKMI